MLTVVCVKAGPLYGADYVNNLAAMVRRHLKVPHRFLCFTDDTRGVNTERRALPGDLDGWWNKLWLFKPGQFRDGQQILFFDLDTVVAGDITRLAQPINFAILRDAYRPGGLQSSVMAWRAGIADSIWTDWEADERPLLAGGDQAYIEIVLHRQFGRKIPEHMILQDLHPGLFASYKAERDKVSDASVIVFHGQPKPHNCDDPFIAQHWHSRQANVTPSAA